MSFLRSTNNSIRLVGTLRPTNWFGSRIGGGRPSFFRQFQSSPIRQRYAPKSHHSHVHGVQEQAMPRFRPPRAPNIIVGSAIAMCTGVFGWAYTQEERAKKGDRKAQHNMITFRQHMVLNQRNIREGRYYTILTSSFAHVTPMHLLFNMMTLWAFGRPIVRYFGGPAFAALWVGSAISCGSAQLWWWNRQRESAQSGSVISWGKERLPEYGALGASGAIMGMLGWTTLWVPRMPISLFFIPMTMAQSSILTAVVSIACIRNDWIPYVGHTGHLGGLAFGMVAYFAAIRRGRMPFR